MVRDHRRGASCRTVHLDDAHAVLRAHGHLRAMSCTFRPGRLRMVSAMAATMAMQQQHGRELERDTRTRVYSTLPSSAVLL